jgi:hypothetical protein
MAMSEGMQISQEEEQQTADQLRALAHRIISVDQKPWFEESGAIEGNFQVSHLFETPTLHAVPYGSLELHPRNPKTARCTISFRFCIVSILYNVHDPSFPTNSAGLL